MSKPPFLRASDLKKVYRVKAGMFRPRQQLHALSDVSLSVDRGEIVGLVGESGCGKSTLSRILLGLEPPTGGAVEIDGLPIASTSRRERSKRIQPVFQDPYGSLNPSMTIGEIIALPLKVHRQGTAAECAALAAQMAEKVGLTARHLGARPGELSGGQRQRVAIARALVIGPELLICDEPTSALDVSVQAQILNLLLDLREATGVAMLFISHDLAVIEHTTDRMIVMYMGRVVEEGPTRDIFEHPRHHYTHALQQAVFTPDDEESELPAAALSGSPPSPLAPPMGCAFHPRCPAARPTCAQTTPALTGDDAGRRVACHFPLDVIRPARNETLTV